MSTVMGPNESTAKCHRRHFYGGIYFQHERSSKLVTWQGALSALHGGDGGNFEQQSGLWKKKAAGSDLPPAQQGSLHIAAMSIEVP